MLPFLLVFFTFTVWPVVMSMGLSFTTYNVFEAPRFLGFENYVKLFFNDSVFLTAMQNTFLLSIIVGDRKSTRLNSSHPSSSRMPSSA